MGNRTRALLLACSTAAILVAGDAAALPGDVDSGVGARGTFTIEVERLAGISYVTHTMSDGAQSSTEHSTVTHFLLNTYGLRLPRSRRHRGYAAIFVVAASLMNFNSNSIGLT